MHLYHTSYQIIREPDVHHGRKNADFGQGFYLTPDYDFACRWAKERKGELPIINTYELDMSNLVIHTFERNMDWFSYLFQNRRNAADGLEADVVIGPIANDTIYDTIGIITSGYLKDAQAVQLLMLGPAYTQVAIKTEKAAKQLAWKESRVVSAEEISSHRSSVLQEQEEYLEAIGKAMEEFE